MPDVQPTPGELAGRGELRHVGTAYVGSLTIGDRIILLDAEVTSDRQGRFFRLSARLSGAWYTKPELDAILRPELVLTSPRRRIPSNAELDDPLPAELRGAADLVRAG